MSHYTMGVITNELKEREIEDKLYYFDENLEDNILSKWDWYMIGGRWNNMLLVKDTVEVINNEKSYEKAPKGYCWCNGAKIKDIEFSLMEEIKRKELEETWERVMNGDDEDDKNYYLKVYETKEKYMKNYCFSLWGYLFEEEWIEQGSMGWWGMNDSTEESIKSFQDRLNEFLQDEKNQELCLTVVDCHI